MVADEFAAAVGEVGWPIDQARPALLAVAGEESSDAADVWKYAAPDRCTAPADRTGRQASKQVEVLPKNTESPKRSFLKVRLLK